MCPICTITAAGRRAKIVFEVSNLIMEVLRYSEVI